MHKYKLLPHVRRKVAKGRVYYYFDTGAKKNGQPVLVRLPDVRSPDFGTMYAAQCGVRTKRVGEKRGPEEMTVRALSTMFQKSAEFRNLAPSSQRQYGIYLARVESEMGAAPADDITRKDVRLMLDKMGDRTGAANATLSVIGSLYSWGRKREYVSVKPTDEMDQAESKDYEPWPDDLLQSALVSENPRVRLFVSMLYYTAQRIEDACKLRWSDLRDGVLYLRQDKTKKQMAIPIHDGLRFVLDATPRTGLTIMAQANSRPFSSQTIRKDLQAFAAERGHKIVPHGLRKNAVNALLEAGCSTAETSAISGHSLQMVEHYAKRRNTDRLASAAILKWNRK